MIATWDHVSAVLATFGAACATAGLVAALLAWLAAGEPDEIDAG